jgi:hypothetical protein
MQRQLPFIRKDFSNIRADIYPVRLWTVAVFLFGVLPVAKKNGIGNMWKIYQYSILRSLSELLIMKILVNRYPKLQQHQISCHAAHKGEEKMKPCGRCEKCRRIIGMLKALGGDPVQCGYTDNQTSKGLENLENKSVKQIGSDAAHLYYLLMSQGQIKKTPHTPKMAKPHPEILSLRFDKERSRLSDLPIHIRKPLFDIFSQYADGSVQRKGGSWKKIELTTQILHQHPFKLETS